MTGNLHQVVLLSTMLPWLAGGCAMQGGAADESVTPNASVPQVASSATQSVSASHKASKAKPQPPAPSALEARHGIQITQLGLTASGGLVDLRFKVLDASKARKLLGDPANAPVLIAGDNPPLIPPRHALHGVKLGEGLVYYILYPNVRNAVRPGVEVMVAMGDVRLGPVTVQ